MLGAFVNTFRIPDLRNKILLTIGLLCIYRVGYHIPVPAYDHSDISKSTQNRDTESPIGRVTEYLQMFSGGRMDQSSLFGLGIMPYISASIILMLCGEIFPALKKLKQEGQAGYRKI